MRHTITRAALDEWLSEVNWRIFASSGGDGSAKRLDVDNGKIFRVTDHGNVVFLGADKDAAIAAYNNAA